MRQFPENYLTSRLKKIACKIEANDLFADIGSDHGYLPCYVCSNDNTVKAIVGEISQGPLKNAQLNIEKYKLDSKIETRLGNGLEVLRADDKLNKIVIAGMGGKLIKNILSADQGVITNDVTLILQANNNEAMLRTYLFENNFMILEEELVKDNNIIYEIIIARKTRNQLSYCQKDIQFGPILRQDRNEIFVEKWQMEKNHLTSIMNQMKKAKNIDTIKFKAYQDQVKLIEEVI